MITTHTATHSTYVVLRAAERTEELVEGKPKVRSGVSILVGLGVEHDVRVEHLDHSAEEEVAEGLYKEGRKANAKG